ncbi:MAG: hypothetical protein QXO32_04225 [Candidatus Bathyarchaeia archaeon]
MNAANKGAAKRRMSVENVALPHDFTTIPSSPENMLLDLYVNCPDTVFAGIVKNSFTFIL